MKNEYFVVLQRFYWNEDRVFIFDKEEAVRHRWVNEAGERIWVVPVDEEHTHTFVWGFPTYEQAEVVYDSLLTEIGIACRAG